MAPIEIIKVKRGNKPEPSSIYIGETFGLLEELLDGRRTVIFVDENLLRVHPTIVNGYSYITIEAGEESKKFANIERIYAKLLELGTDRSTFLVGIGGGVVTDIAGFVASTYMRGLSFGFVPTTLLSQVDASVGGKNGVNLMGYKNIVGTFNQPDFVLCDMSLLSTLPEREMRSGMAEAVKAGIIGDQRLFAIFRENSFNDIISKPRLLQEVITRSIRVKATVVEHDELERSFRRLLNLGHTFAHSIEKLSNRYTHGEAVAVGISMIGQLSEKLIGTDPAIWREIIAVFRLMGLPTSTDIPFHSILDESLKDKKRVGRHIYLTLIEYIGNCRVVKLSIEEFLNLKIHG